MARIMFSGGSTPSSSAHSRNTRQGSSSLSHTNIRFQNPIMLSSIGVLSAQACAFLIALTYM